MEIAPFLVKSTTSVSAGDTGVSQASDNSSSSFNEYMNSFLEVASEVKQVRRTENYSQNNERLEHKESKCESGVKRIKKFETNNDDPFDSEQNDAFPLVPMTPLEKEAFERIAVMIADGGLDAETLSELSEDELNEIVDWVLEGAGGIFEPYVENDLVEETIPNDELAQTVDFGLEKSISALNQLEELYSRIDDKVVIESDSAVIGKLIDLDNLDTVEIDKLSQAILELVEKCSGLQGENIDENINEVEGELSLRELLETVPVEELIQTIEGVLEEISKIDSLPVMPEAVLKSLAIEVVNVNNKMLDAAELNNSLLDGLSNNSDLREQILSEISGQNNSEELISSVVDIPTSQANSKVVDTLVEAVLEDSSDEELEALASESGENEEAHVEIVTDNVVDELLTIQPVGDTALADQVAVVDEVTKQTANTKTAEVDVQTLVENEDVKITVKEEVVAIPQDTVKDNEKDGLTGRALSGDNSLVEDEGVLEEENTDRDGEQSNSESDFEDDLFNKEERQISSKSSFNENFADADAKIDFKAFNPEVNQTGYISSTSNVRYSDMIENIDKLSKLMMSTADKTMKSVTMELSPPELGKMTIEVSVKNGQASAAIRVETDGARNMLMNNLDQLKKNLESHGLKLENFEVELNKQEQQDRHQQSSFAQAQEDERERRSKRRQNGNNTQGGDGGTEINEAESIDGGGHTGGVASDGSVDIVA